MNKTSATEWIVKAWHNLSGAELFYKVNHYTDVTAVELYYCIEKSLKAFVAYENKKIPKTHDLIEIYNLVEDYINLEDNVVLLKQITKYYIEEFYPAFERTMPSQEEIKEVLDFAFEVFDRVCIKLEINKEDVK